MWLVFYPIKLKEEKMKPEIIEIIGAFALFAGAAILLNSINKKRKKYILRKMYSYSNVPRFIEHQLNRTHQG